MDTGVNLRGQDEFELEFREIASRDWQLWSLGLLVIVVVALGFVSLMAPTLWGFNLLVQNRLLPQLFSGFLVLVVLFNVYIVTQKKALNATRDRLLKRILREQRGENALLLDPLTQVFSAQYFEQAVTRELSRTERQSRPLSFVTIDILHLRSVRSKYGEAAREHLLTATAEILRSNLRGSDTICRVGPNRFVIMLPDTSESQAAVPTARLLAAVEHWNQSTSFAYKLAVEVCLAPHQASSDWHNWAAQHPSARRVQLPSLQRQSYQA